MNVLVSREDLPDKFFVDTLDLYSARQRATFEKQAAIDIGLLMGYLAAVSRELEQPSRSSCKTRRPPASRR